MEPDKSRTCPAGRGQVISTDLSPQTLRAEVELKLWCKQTVPLQGGKVPYGTSWIVPECSGRPHPDEKIQNILGASIGVQAGVQHRGSCAYNEDQNLGTPDGLVSADPNGL